MPKFSELYNHENSKYRMTFALVVNKIILKKADTEQEKKNKEENKENLNDQNDLKNSK